MVASEDIAPDIAILLAQTWKNHNSEPIDRETVCRIWAFDLGWFDMETATRIRDNLVNTGWLEESTEGMQPGIEILAVNVPFGWLPTMRLLENPPHLPKGVPTTTVTESLDTPPPMENIAESLPIDPASTRITTLLDQIASASGLDRKEVMRRAQRKRRALGPVTLWMTLLLVAREQQLPMQAFIRTITS
tara:strand:- start:113 stop:682 length:570 start_codon:yes stop_codon:yes gene_type:complete